MIPYMSLKIDIWAASWENQRFAYAKTKTLISAFVFATWIVQYLYFLNQKFPASTLAISSSCTAWFVSDLARIHNVGFLSLGLIYSN